MATIRDLAKYTGFSVTTISRVLNHDPTLSVTDHTRSTILEAADELNYFVTKKRRTVKERPFHIAIAEMMSPREQLYDPYYLYLKNYVVRSCMEKGSNVSYLSEQGGRYQMLDKVPLDGILAIGIFSEKQMDQLLEISQSVVFVDSAPNERQFDSVVLNLRLGVEQALSHLIEKGHRKIGFLGPTNKLDQRKRTAPEVRRQYFREYMEKEGIFEPEWMIDTMDTAQGTRESLRRWLQKDRPRPTAFLAYNEETAISAASVMKEAGVRIPEDISLISFNDTPLSILIEPPLTSVNAPLAAMGDMAVKLLTERIGDPGHIPCKVVLPMSLMERSSVKSLSK